MEMRAERLIPSVTEKSRTDVLSDLKKRKRVVLVNKAMIGCLIIALVVWSWIGTNFNLSFLYTGFTNITKFIFTDLLPPDFRVIGRYINPALQTLYMSYVGMVISVILSIVLGFMAAKNTSFHPVLALISRSIITFIRAVPSIIIGMLLVVTLGLGPLAGTIALGIGGVGILGKAFADLLEGIDKGQVEAIRATGANWFQVMGQGVWPQFKPGFVAWSLYKMDLNIREAAVLGIIGAGGIGYTLQGNINLFQYKQASVGILMIFILILIVEFTTAKVREKIL
ncbi:phosphonate transport system permease protein [Natronobacillus azotifigens]|uniref:Phosphonate ABC transporter, permease protein PhnE n=1 Tax=Natronobacillus azotifigens TaxID=472978 RepID=A0A9J6R9H7_9BACI|nr:phosphonate ABC transporter, permease protein PhnE [Natronobacillus azotifigens]MCZ0702296.1 phosphonate ABC transporter, permease protein PhnE [Natronobacillus azotifigens]